MNTNNLDNILSKYLTMHQENANNNIEKPILVVANLNGEKCICLKSKKDIPFFQKLLAYFGYGEASLKNVCQVLQEHRWEVKDNKANEALDLINDKIDTRNNHSWVQRIQPITRSYKALAVSTASCVAETTYHPAGSTPEIDKKGILDFTYVLPEQGIAYVADGSGHGNPIRQPKLEAAWNDFNTFLKQNSSEITRCNSEEKMKEIVKDWMDKLNEKFSTETVVNSTLSLCMLIERKGKKYALFLSIGDSSLIHVKKDGSLEYITQARELARKEGYVQTELSALDKDIIFLDIKEIESGDKIYGCTDGITDFLPKEKLDVILSSNKHTEASALLADIKQEIQNINPPYTEEEAIKKEREFVLTNPTHFKPFLPTFSKASDDVSLFLMVVP